MDSHTILMKDVLVRFASGFLGCMLIGFIFFQFNIFDAKSWAFDFVRFGALTAIFFALLQSLTVRNAIAAYIVLSLINQAILPKPYEMSFSLFWNLLEHIVIGIAVYLFWRFSFSGKKNKVIRPLMLAGYFMIAWAFISIMLRVYANWYEGLIHLIYRNIQHGLLMGLGLGVGIEVGNLFLKHNGMLTKRT